MKNTFKRVLTLVVALAMVVSCFAMLSTVSVMAAPSKFLVWGEPSENLIAASYSTMDAMPSDSSDKIGTSNIVLEEDEDPDHGSVVKVLIANSYSALYWRFSDAALAYMTAHPADAYKITFSVDVKGSEDFSATIGFREFAGGSTTNIYYAPDGTTSVRKGVALTTSWQTVTHSFDVNADWFAKGARLGADGIDETNKGNKYMYWDNLVITISCGTYEIAVGKLFTYIATSEPTHDSTNATFPVIRGNMGLTSAADSGKTISYTVYNLNDYAIAVELTPQNDWDSTGFPGSGRKQIPAHSALVLSATLPKIEEDGTILDKDGVPTKKGETTYIVDPTKVTLRFNVTSADGKNWLIGGAKVIIAFNNLDGTDPLKNCSACNKSFATTEYVASLPDYSVNATAPNAVAIQPTKTSTTYVMSNTGNGTGVFGGVDAGGKLTKKLTFAMFFTGEETSNVNTFQIAMGWGSNFSLETFDTAVYDEVQYKTAWNKLFPDDQQDVPEFTMPEYRSYQKTGLALKNGNMAVFTLDVPMNGTNFNLETVYLMKDGTSTSKLAEGTAKEDYVTYYRIQNNHYDVTPEHLGVRINGTFKADDRIYLACLNERVVNNNFAAIASGYSNTWFFADKFADNSTLAAATSQKFADLCDLRMGASVAIGEDLTVNFMANKPGTMTLNETEIEGVAVEEGYKFAYTGVNPQCMGDEISGTFTVDGFSVAVNPYSVKTYCEDMAAKPAYTEFLNLLADMLEYGAATQQYKGYKTDALVNDVAALADYKTTFAAPETDKASIQAVVTNAPAQLKSMALLLDNTLNIIVRVTVNGEGDWYPYIEANGVEVTITENLEEGYFLIEGIAASDIDKVFDIYLKSGSENIHGVSYSLNSYIASKCTKTDKTGVLVQALSCFGNSAKAYAEIAG